MTRWLLAAVTTLALVACGTGMSTEARSGSARLVIDNPHAGQVLSVRSVGIAVHVEGVNQYRLHYYVDGNDRGEGDTSQTLTSVTPGTHHVEVEALDSGGNAFKPALRAGVDFVIQ